MPTERGSRVGAFLLHGWTLLLLGLYAYVRTRPATPTAIPGPADSEARWWGLWPVTYAPDWAFWLGAGTVLLALGWGLRRQFAAGRPAGPGTAPRGLLLACAGLLLLGFYLLPIVHTRWGDAYILANGIAWPDPALRITHSWQAPLDVWLHSRVWLALHGAFGWETAIPVYRLLSPVAGGLYLAAALQLSRADWLAPGWLTFGLLASIGVVQLFFGYVENYSFAAAGVLAYLWLGLLASRGERPLWQPATALALTVAFHPSALALAPSLLLLAWDARAEGEWRRRAGQFGLQVALPFALVAGGTLLLMELGGHGIRALLADDAPGGGDKRWLVPLFQTSTRWEHYTMWSWPHLRDFINQQALVAPAVLPGLVLLGIASRAWRQAGGVSTAGRFLLTATGGYLLLTWLWNPDYGGQRDWDLFSLAYIPAALLLVWLLPRVLPDSRRRAGAVLPLLLLQALFTAAWIYQNRLPWAWPG